MKQLLVLVTLVLFTSLAFAQTEATVDQTGTSNYADIHQTNGGGSSGIKIDVDQTAGTYNEVYMKQAGKGNSMIDLDQTATGMYNYADVTQNGASNDFDLDQTAGGYNYMFINQAISEGFDVHDNIFTVDQTATGNNDATIIFTGRKKQYNKNVLDLFQDASAGNNFMDIYSDVTDPGQRSVKVKSEQYSMDNYLKGTINSVKTDIDIYQTAAGNNHAEFETLSGAVHTPLLDVYQNTSVGDNYLNSYQEENSSAVISQTSHVGGNSAIINQTK